jgi:type II secretory pathway component PulF
MDSSYALPNSNAAGLPPAHDAQRPDFGPSSGDNVLVEGFRALAAEISTKNVRRALLDIAQQLDNGRSLDEAARCLSPAVSPHVRAVIAAAGQTRFPGEPLVDFLEDDGWERRFRNYMIQALAYPSLLLLEALIIFCILNVFVLVPLLEFAREFAQELEVLPALSQRYTYHLAGWPATIAMLSLLAVPVLLVVMRFAVGRAAFASFMGLLPAVGPLFRDTAIVRISRVVGRLTGQGMPLPQALRMSASSAENSSIAQSCQDLATGTERGEPLARLIAQDPRLPITMVPFVHWGEQASALPEAFDAIQEIFEVRVRSRQSLLETVLPALAFLVIGLLAAVIAGSLFTSLQFLMRVLSSFK